MNWNLVGSIYGRFTIKIADFVPIHWQRWPPQAILVSPVAAMFANESGRNEHLYRGPSIHAFYQISVHSGKRFPRRMCFRNQPIRNKNKKYSPLKPLSRMNWNLVGSIYGRSSIKMLISSRSVNKHGHHRQFLFLIGWFLKKNLLLWNKQTTSGVLVFWSEILT
jgi:hypothetical protein